MPKRNSKLKKHRNEKGRNSNVHLLGELTVNDFANSEVERKGYSLKMGLATMMKTQTQDITEDDRAWDEKDEEEFEENGLDSVVKFNRGTKRHQNLNEITEGVEYPLDIWFLISEKINPEDVGRFAAICQATYYVVSTARFWFTLHRRYYKWTAKLPERLDIHILDNLRGLKATVIRSLFYLYVPFSTLIAKEEPLSGHPAKLTGAQCVLQWHNKPKNYHRYIFLFAKQVKVINRPQNHPQSLPDLLKDSAVHCNADEGCYILEAKSNAVCHIPMAIGNYLHSGQIGLSAGLCNHRLQMTVGPEYLLPRNNPGMRRGHKLSTTEIFQIMIEPVLDVRIYPWWHPHYLTILHDSYKGVADVNW
ncbi:hypothetical protein SK128_002570 [Halocaridina rubra]|uniref:Transmembrane protein 183 n=1 Tax=Halocaridina rubra TaxID=373956 RepID=A0AAN8WMI6_HALRR